MSRKEYPLELAAYNWNGTFAPGPNARFPYPNDPINVTRGSTIEFIAKNAARQPNYYEVSIEDTELVRANKDAWVMENERLDRNQLSMNFKEGNYVVHVVGYWVDVDLFGQLYRHAAYAQIINVD